MAVLPAASVLRLVRAVLPPMGPEKSVAPLLLATKSLPPFTAPVNVMLPEPALTVRLPLSVVVLPKETALLVVLSIAPGLAPIVIAPLYDCVPVLVTVLALI